MDTIFAPATARGKAGISVVRLSGAASHDAVQALCGTLPAIQRASLRKLEWMNVEIDEAIVILFQAGRSFTGEAMAELHLHGSVAVVAAVLRALSEQPGLRLAEAGEFTRRALENGKLDLSQVEGLADLIESETEAQRRQALRVLSGAIGERAELWRRQLIRAAALLEATIDFVDEDVPVDVMPEVTKLLSDLLGQLRQQADGVGIAERIREGFEVAIVGAPNVGKSTLLNFLAGREAAITSEHAGTTRDVIEVRMDLGGLPVMLLDTAGLRETTDDVEKIGISRALNRAASADLRVFITLDGEKLLGLPFEAGDVIVCGKGDVAKNLHGGLAVSGKTGDGVAELLGKIVAELSGRLAGSSTLINERHRAAAINAIEALEQAQVEISIGTHRTELAAESMRQAIRCLDVLVGRIGVETLLDEIFSSFCIGK